MSFRWGFVVNCLFIFWRSRPPDPPGAIESASLHCAACTCWHDFFRGNRCLFRREFRWVCERKILSFLRIQYFWMNLPFLKSGRFLWGRGWAEGDGVRRTWAGARRLPRPQSGTSRTGGTTTPRMEVNWNTPNHGRWNLEIYCNRH